MSGGVEVRADQGVLPLATLEAIPVADLMEAMTGDGPFLFGEEEAVELTSALASGDYPNATRILSIAGGLLVDEVARLQGSCDEYYRQDMGLLAWGIMSIGYKLRQTEEARDAAEITAVIAD